MGLRDIIPATLLRLNKDQECYDFIKWYETEGQRSDYDWGNMSLPFLEVKGADVLEDVNYLIREYASIHNLASVMLLKLKLLVDILRIKLTRKVIYNRVPPELWARMEQCVVRSPLSQQWAGISYRALTAIKQKLEVHIKRIANAINKSNDHFVYMMLDADEYLSEIPQYSSSGSAEEVLLLLQHSYAAWWEHEGVLELLRSSRTIAGKDSEDEIEGMMASTTFASNPGSDRSKKELLDDVSRNRLWGYFDDAVEDAFSLAARKPSDVRREQAKEAWQRAEEDDRKLMEELGVESEDESD